MRSHPHNKAVRIETKPHPHNKAVHVETMSLTNVAGRLRAKPHPQRPATRPGRPRTSSRPAHPHPDWPSRTAGVGSSPLPPANTRSGAAPPLTSSPTSHGVVRKAAGPLPDPLAGGRSGARPPTLASEPWARRRHAWPPPTSSPTSHGAVRKAGTGPMPEPFAARSGARQSQDTTALPKSPQTSPHTAGTAGAGSRHPPHSVPRSGARSPTSPPLKHAGSHTSTATTGST